MLFVFFPIKKSEETMMQLDLVDMDRLYDSLYAMLDTVAIQTQSVAVILHHQYIIPTYLTLLGALLLVPLLLGILFAKREQTEMTKDVVVLHMLPRPAHGSGVASSVRSFIVFRMIC